MSIEAGTNIKTSCVPDEVIFYLGGDTCLVFDDESLETFLAIGAVALQKSRAKAATALREHELA
ncbi:MAG TPA: hypothetical protein VG317_00150 [Pseudonocardiaceae bacterium]|nr:hypothetical protein [Pseudonocardiaceae bacterium]